MHLQGVADPAGLPQARVPHQAVQPLAVHAAERMQREERGDGAAPRAAVLGLPGEGRVPGAAWRGVGHGTTGGGTAAGLALRQDHGLQGGDG